VLDTPDLWVPLVNMRGVYVLPGIPRLFRAMVDANKARFVGPAHLTDEAYTKVWARVGARGTRVRVCARVLLESFT
jgi:molybdopterin-biosynthesis enzyme MoeA-like protein